MSNKVQISCNSSNRKHIKIIKEGWNRLELDQNELIIIQREEKELLERILKMRKECHPNTAIQMVSYGRVRQRIVYLKFRISLVKKWIKESSNSLIIC